jgi:hypothetical protein
MMIVSPLITCECEWYWYDDNFTVDDLGMEMVLEDDSFTLENL